MKAKINNDKECMGSCGRGSRVKRHEKSSVISDHSLHFALNYCRQVIEEFVVCEAVRQSGTPSQWGPVSNQGSAFRGILA